MQEIVLQHEVGAPDGQVILPDGTKIGQKKLLKANPLTELWSQNEDGDVLGPTSRSVCFPVPPSALVFTLYLP
jgi:hypothetical protein